MKMISIWSILVTVVMSNVFILAFCILSRKTFYVQLLGIPVLLLLLLMIIIRMLLPIEFPFAKVFLSTTFLPRIYSFFSSPLFTNVADINLLTLIDIIWIIGTLIQVLKPIRHYYKLKKSLSFCPDKTDIDQSVLLKVASICNLPKQLKMVETSAVSAPLIFGFFKPTVVFPTLNFTSEEQYFILRHELKHYHNKDIWVKTFIELICALYWWNPLVYTLRERTDRILEINVDLSISAEWEEPERLQYLAFLLNTYKKSSLSIYKRKMYGTLGVADGDQSTIVQRFEILFSNNKVKFSKAKALITGAILIFMLVISFSYIVQPHYFPPIDSESNAYALTSDNAYLVKRLDGEYDVYIYNVGYFTTIQKIEDPYTKLTIKEK